MSAPTSASNVASAFVPIVKRTNLIIPGRRNNGYAGIHSNLDERPKNASNARELRSSSNSFSTSDYEEEEDHTRHKRSSSFTPSSSSSPASYQAPSTPQGRLHASSSQLPIVKRNPSMKVFLQYSWTFWYDDDNYYDQEKAKNNSVKIGTFNTIQDFWRYYNNMIDPGQFPMFSNLRLFKREILPVWEDPSNQYGGRWTIQSPKSQVGKNWMRVVLAVIGEQLSRSEDICGVVLSVRPTNDCIHVWNKTSSDSSLTYAIAHELGTILQSSITIPYKPHKRNTSDVSSSNVLHRPAPETRGSTRRSYSLTENVRSGSQITPMDDSISDDEHSYPLDVDGGCDYDSSGESKEDVTEEVSGSRHKKSESFSTSPFDNFQEQVEEETDSYKQHRKTRSESQKRSSGIPSKALRSGKSPKSPNPAPPTSIEPTRTRSLSGVEESVAILSTATLGENGDGENSSSGNDGKVQPMQQRAALKKKANAELETLKTELYKPKMESEQFVPFEVVAPEPIPTTPITPHPVNPPTAIPKMKQSLKPAVSSASSPILTSKPSRPPAKADSESTNKENFAGVSSVPPSVTPAQLIKNTMQAKQQEKVSSIARAEEQHDIDIASVKGGSPWFVFNIVAIVLIIALAYGVFMFNRSSSVMLR